jgi:SAM-dependent methyltransferase
MASFVTRARRRLARMIAPSAAPTAAPAAGSAGETPDLRTEIVRRYLTGVGQTRMALAQRYIKGVGIEFGALDFPTPVPPNVHVVDADFKPANELKTLFMVDENVTSAKLMTDLESMDGIGDESQDFIIANHVFEHVEDPLKALRSLSRVLRPDGVAFLAIPDKRSTFDKPRAVTNLDHLLRDHREGPDVSLAGHYQEWVHLVDGLSGEAYDSKVACMLEQRSNIHFHCWDFAAMMELFTYVEREESFRLMVENATLNSIEVVWILRKRAA